MVHSECWVHKAWEEEKDVNLVSSISPEKMEQGQPEIKLDQIFHLDGRATSYLFVQTFSWTYVNFHNAG